MSPTQELAMKMALERLKISYKMCGFRADAEAAAALEAALAEPVQEPVAWMYSDDHDRMLKTETFCTVYSVKVGSPDKGVTDVPLYTAPPQHPAEPVGVITSMVKGGMTWHRWPADMPDGTPLYTAPPQRPPLSDDEIKRIDDGTMFHESSDWSLRFARAIEQAHGIS